MLTGTQQSTPREALEHLIKRHNGRVTGQVRSCPLGEGTLFVYTPLALCTSPVQNQTPLCRPSPPHASQVSGKTSFLVAGAGSGGKKIALAKEKEVRLQREGEGGNLWEEYSISSIGFFFFHAPFIEFVEYFTFILPLALAMIIHRTPPADPDHRRGHAHGDDPIDGTSGGNGGGGGGEQGRGTGTHSSPIAHCTALHFSYRPLGGGGCSTHLGLALFHTL